MTAEPQINGDITGGSSIASTPPSQAIVPPVPASAISPWIDDEPVVKSPPEPTRVKSPEQMIMRSPEPVNWTVPLDTGKTFTVTQNVREGRIKNFFLSLIIQVTIKPVDMKILVVQMCSVPFFIIIRRMIQI